MMINYQNKRPRSFPQGSQPNGHTGASLTEVLVTIAIVVLLVALFLPATRTPREASRRSQCKNNLKQIGLALHNYEEDQGALPPAHTVDANGRPLHSWRTLILPYLDQKPLYERIDLSKPWNDPVNAEAFAAHLPAYVCPSTDIPDGHTTYLALVGPECAFQPVEPREFREFQDGTSNTVLVIDAAASEAVHWMKPTDSGSQFFLKFNDKNEQSHTGGFHALMGDGTVRFLSSTLSAETRQALLTIAGDETLGEF
jgi:type II secretory pathway pseudopilin PulG